jgi:hypothetical protein
MTLQHEVHVAMPGMAEVLALVAEERARQLEKWGPQSHPDLDPEFSANYVALEASAKEVNDSKAIAGDATWDTILLEEVFEALTAGTVAERIKELTEVAAVAVAWIEDLRGRNATQ